MTVFVGDCRETLKTLGAETIQTCVTSPPYWGLRDYGHDSQLGLEETPDAYVASMVEVFREVRRVLRPDGTLWLNLGDSYASSPGLKPKDLCGIPWRVAFALQTDGWWLRSDIIWSKPNPMPESVTDRPTKAHEYVFLLSKSKSYFYDAKAIAEPSVIGEYQPKNGGPSKYSLGSGRNDGSSLRGSGPGSKSSFPTPAMRNARSVWRITPKPFRGAHFAVMPPELARRCILAGSRPGDTVLDPFSGAGTTLLVAEENKRLWIGCELSETYAEMALSRIRAHREAA